MDGNRHEPGVGPPPPVFIVQGVPVSTKPPSDKDDDLVPTKDDASLSSSVEPARKRHKTYDLFSDTIIFQVQSKLYNLSFVLL